MATTISLRRLHSSGSLKRAIIDIDITSYTTNGEDVSAAGLGIGGDPIMLKAIATEKVNLIPIWDTANKKLELGVTSTGVELANGQDGGTWRLEVEYRG